MSNVVRLEYAYGVCPKCKCTHYLRYLIHNDGLIHKPYEIKCINCNSYFAKEDILGSRDETEPKPITNADRLRAMSDEEIEDWYWWMHKEMMYYTDSRVFVHEWLKSPTDKKEIK